MRQVTWITAKIARARLVRHNAAGAQVKLRLPFSVAMRGAEYQFRATVPSLLGVERYKRIVEPPAVSNPFLFRAAASPQNPSQLPTRDGEARQLGRSEFPYRSCSRRLPLPH